MKESDFKITDELFCKIESQFNGEHIDKVEQLAMRKFNGRELKEYIEHALLVIDSEPAENPNTSEVNLPIQFVSPRLFYVMNHARDNGEEFMEQLSIGLDTYEDAVKFRDSDYHKKKDPNCFILCSINEG